MGNSNTRKPSISSDTHSEINESQKRKLTDEIPMVSFLCFSYSQRNSHEDIEWLQLLIHECQIISDDCRWAEKILDHAFHLEGYKSNYYQSQLKKIGQPGRKSNPHYQTEIYNNYIYSLNQLNEQKQLQKLYKKSHLFEENSSDSSPRQSQIRIKGGQNHPFKLSSFDSKSSFQSINPHKQSFDSMQPQKSHIYPIQMLNKSSSGDSVQFKEILQHYVLITQQISQHINEKDCALHFIKKIFINCFLEDYQAEITQILACKDHIQAHGKLLAAEDGAIYELQEFIRIYHQTISLFYNLPQFNNQRYPMYKNENLINFTTSNMFENQQLYDMVFKLVSMLFRKEEIHLLKIQKKSLYKTPQDFQVPDKFCLNELTAKYFTNKFTIFQNICQKLIPQTLQTGEIWELPVVQNQNQEEEKKDPPPNNQKTDKKKEPYYKCIQQLNKIEKKQGSISKIRQIIKVSETIIQCINEFHNTLGHPFNNAIDSDSILSIFSYLVSKCNVKNLHAHCKLIEKFSTNNMINSIAGYYLITMQATLYNLIECHPDLKSNNLKMSNLTYTINNDSLELE